MISAVASAAFMQALTPFTVAGAKIEVIAGLIFYIVPRSSGNSVLGVASSCMANQVPVLTLGIDPSPLRVVTTCHLRESKSMHRKMVVQDGRPLILKMQCIKETDVVIATNAEWDMR